MGVDETKLQKYIVLLTMYFEKLGVDIRPLPRISFNRDTIDIDDLLTNTAHYNFIDNTITLNISNRQIKDILRSYAHELFHHHQFITDRQNFLKSDKSGDINTNKELTKIEGEAYKYGNLIFRNFTLQIKDVS